MPAVSITPYNRLVRFIDYALAHTAQPYNASDHDAELDAIETTVDGLVNNLGILQRADGLLANATCHPDALSTATKALIGAGNTGQLNWTPKGLWATATVYALGNVVEQAGTSYVCAAAHTSGVFATDKTAGKWIFLGGTLISLAASSVTFTPAGNIAATDVQAALQELDAEKALLAGASTQTFKVATPTTGQMAVPADDVLKQTDWFLALVAAVADTYTATISVTSLVALTDGMEVPVRFPSANGSTTPTFNLTLSATATGAKTIVNESGGALKAADIAANMEGRLRYRSSTDKWVLLARVGVPVPGAVNTVLTSAGPTAQPTWLGLPAQNALAATRQAILAAKVDSSGYNAAFAAGTGLACDLSATATNMVLSFAAGFNSSGSLDYVSALTADQASFVSALPASNTSYLFADFASSSSVTWASTLVPPQYGYAFDKAQNSLLHFDAATITCDFGNTYTANGGAATSTTKPAYGTRSLDLSGGATSGANTKGVYTTGINSFGPSSWEVSAVVWFDVAPAAAINHAVIAANSSTNWGLIAGWGETGGNRRAVLFVSSTNTSWDIANGLYGTTNLTTGKWYRFRHAFDALAGTYRLYVADGGSGATPVWTAEVQEITVSSAARVCSFDRLSWGVYSNGGVFSLGMSGYLDEARFTSCATKPSAETPSGYPLTVADYRVNWFSIPEMKMYEVTGASASAGTNPAMTAKNRVFVGEADTGAASVSAVRNYAVRGQYIGQLNVFPAAGALLSANHNIGVRPQRGRVGLRNVSTDAGHSPGDELDRFGEWDATDAALQGTGPLMLLTPKVIGYQRTSIATTHIFVPAKSTGGITKITEGRWNLIFYADRGW